MTLTIEEIKKKIRIKVVNDDVQDDDGEGVNNNPKKNVYDDGGKSTNENTEFKAEPVEINLESTTDNKGQQGLLKDVKVKDFVDPESLTIFKDVNSGVENIKDESIKEIFNYLKNITLTTNDLTNEKLRDLKIKDIDAQISKKIKPIQDEIDSIDSEKKEMKSIEQYLKKIDKIDDFKDNEIDIGEGTTKKKLFFVLKELDLMDEFQDLKKWYEETTKEVKSDTTSAKSDTTSDKSDTTSAKEKKEKKMEESVENPEDDGSGKKTTGKTTTITTTTTTTTTNTGGKKKSRKNKKVEKIKK